MEKILVIYGPTAAGKTDLAISLAKKYKGELISADSRQVYKGLDLCTGKVSLESKVEKYRGYWIVNGVKIHGFDLVKPGIQFTVADFLKNANSSIVQTIKLKKLPIIVGGTGFYIKTLIDGIDSIGIPPNPKLRCQLEELSPSDLYQKLEKIDPNRAKSMNKSDRANPRRLIRAIEIAIYNRLQKTIPLSGTDECEKAITYFRGMKNKNDEGFLRSSKLKDNTEGFQPSEVYNQKLETRNSKPKTIDYSSSLSDSSELIIEDLRAEGRLSTTDYLLVGLTAPNAYLYDRADLWLSTRIEKGMIEEVKHLLNLKIDPQWLDSLGLECRWFSRYIIGRISKEESTARLIGDYHSFIRRQKTWFHKFSNLKLFDIKDPTWQSQLEKTVKTWNG